MPKYVKKPVEIEARRVPDADQGPEAHSELATVAEWCGGDMVADAVDGWCIIINTLEGDMKAQSGDMVIKGVKEEFYPCKPDIFYATYDAV